MPPRSVSTRASCSPSSTSPPPDRTPAMSEQPSTDKVAIVLGATRGIGRAIALGLGRAGMTVLPTGRTLDASAVVADEIIAAGGRATPVAVDLRDVEATAATIAAA